MTSESKILTVSYGTFSCTLEGFDNPFDTMKAIAEYFRDLAAQDRHFGAEPPPPDAAMLHRLAEREVSRLAAGKLDDTARMKTAETMDGPAPRIQINPGLRRPAQPPLDTAGEGAATGAAPEPSLTDVIPDGVAAKLARIRKAVNPAATVAEAPFVADPEVSAPAEPVEDVAVTDFALDDADTALDAAPAGDAPSQPGDDAADVAARLGALISSGPAAVQDELAPVATAELMPDDAWTDDHAEETVAFAAELESAEPIDITADAPAAFAIDEEADLALSPDDVDGADMVASAEHPVEDDFTAHDVALLAQLDGTVFDEDSLTASLDDTLPEDRVAAPDLAEVALQDPLPEALDAESTADDLPEDPVAAELDAAEDFTADAFVDPAPEPVAEAPVAEAAASEDVAFGKPGSRARRVNSRVVRIHPDEEPRDPGATRVLDTDEESDEVARLMQQADEVMAEEENRRRHEALSRLKAAVVATEADRADVDYEAPKSDASLDPYRGDLAEAIQPDLAPEPKPAPDVKPTRRKSVVIRPATEPRPGTIRPGMISPPPLVLVSEQRIDRVAPAAAPAPAPSVAPSAPEGQPMVALRTGRLSGAIGAGAAVATSGLPARNLVLEKPSYGPVAETEEDEELAEDSKEINEAGLASFAEMVGARSMAEMLEAAAAYATCVENRTHFTRPQLMRRMMASAGGKPVSREDGLRSFGTLLRTGRIEKVTRGHYSLAENSPYLAEARRLS